MHKFAAYGLSLYCILAMPTWLLAEEAKAKPALVVSSAFWQCSNNNFFAKIGVDVDKNNGSFVLSEIENFFLICRGDAKPLPGWKLNKYQSASFEIAVIVKYSEPTALTNDSASITVSKPDDEKRMTVTIEPTSGSTFTLKSKVELSAVHGDRIYLPTSALRNDGKDVLYIVIWLDTGETP